MVGGHPDRLPAAGSLCGSHGELREHDDALRLQPDLIDFSQKDEEKGVPKESRRRLKVSFHLHFSSSN